jgi:hypothetical protein
LHAGRDSALLTTKKLCFALIFPSGALRFGRIKDEAPTIRLGSWEELGSF